MRIAARAEIAALTDECASLQSDRDASAAEWTHRLEESVAALGAQKHECERVRGELDEVMARRETEMNRLSAQYEEALETHRMMVCVGWMDRPVSTLGFLHIALCQTHHFKILSRNQVAYLTLYFFCFIHFV
jgi:hypothetical protein